MGYIRTKDGRIIDTTKEKEAFLCNQRAWCPKKGYVVYEQDIVAQSGNIEDLCDYWDVYDLLGKEYIIAPNSNDIDCGHSISDMRTMLEKNYIENVKLAIRTDKGIIYVAKMNEKGELELL